MLYLLQYKYLKAIECDSPIYSCFALGIFDTLDKVNEAIEYYRIQKGFSEHKNAFQLTFLDVSAIDKSVYMASYSHIGDRYCDDKDIVFDVCETYDLAKEVIDEWKTCFNGFLDEDFIIDKWIINELEWKNGFH